MMNRGQGGFITLDVPLTLGRFVLRNVKNVGGGLVYEEMAQGTLQLIGEGTGLDKEGRAENCHIWHVTNEQHRAAAEVLRKRQRYELLEEALPEGKFIKWGTGVMKFGIFTINPVGSVIGGYLVDVAKKRLLNHYDKKGIEKRRLMYPEWSKDPAFRSAKP